jgi:hypothetical protein
MYSDAHSIDSVFMVVKDHPDYEDMDDVRLAEMAFQRNWHQDNQRICEMCTLELGKGVEIADCCGHLTFVKPINPAF